MLTVAQPFFPYVALQASAACANHGRMRQMAKRMRGSNQHAGQTTPHRQITSGETMKYGNIFKTTALAALVGVCASVQAAPDPSSAATAPRDGQHDFDFNFGSWKSHIKRRVHPLSGSSDVIELVGTVNTRKVWDGRAQLEEIEADGPKGHWQGMTLFLYNPQSHQWSQSFSSSAAGTISGSLIGSFKDGCVELFAADTFEGRSILVRGVWSGITPASHHYEESYSDDGGKTWESEFNADLTKTDLTKVQP
jgi:hypothetical protein